MTQSVSSNSITSLVSSKLTGALPAISGAALTGVNAGVFSSTSNPTVTSNKTLGFIWANSVTGDLFNCIDATTNNNVWKNVGSGVDHVHDTSSFQGEIAGFVSGGYSADDGNTFSNNIDRFSLLSDVEATQHGDLTAARYQSSGQSSTTHGYTSGGNGWNVIDKFTFASAGNATDVGDMPELNRKSTCGHSSSTHGYAAGGATRLPSTVTIDVIGINKFSFSSDGNAPQVATLTLARSQASGNSSSTHGYTAGGTADPGTSTDQTRIDKFTFASDSNATTVGTLAQRTVGVTGQSSSTDGYTTGGYSYTLSPAAASTEIDKWSFSSDGNATDVGDLQSAVSAITGISATTKGYSAGQGSTSKIIQYFSYSSNVSGTQVGNLTLRQEFPSGTQY